MAIHVYLQCCYSLLRLHLEKCISTKKRFKKTLQKQNNSVLTTYADLPYGCSKRCLVLALTLSATSDDVEQYVCSIIVLRC